MRSFLNKPCVKRFSVHLFFRILKKQTAIQVFHWKKAFFNYLRMLLHFWEKLSIITNRFSIKFLLKVLSAMDLCLSTLSFSTVNILAKISSTSISLTIASHSRKFPATRQLTNLRGHASRDLQRQCFNKHFDISK